MYWKRILEHIRDNPHLIAFGDTNQQEIINELNKLLNNCDNIFVKALNIESTTLVRDTQTNVLKADINIRYLKMENGANLYNPRIVYNGQQKYIVFYSDKNVSFVSFIIQPDGNITHYNMFGKMGTSFIIKNQYYDWDYDIIHHPTDPNVFFMVIVGNNPSYLNLPDIQVVMFDNFVPVMAYYVSKQDLFDFIRSHSNFGGSVPGRSPLYNYTGCLSTRYDQITNKVYVLTKNDFYFDRWYELVSIDMQTVMDELYNGNNFDVTTFMDVIDWDIYKISYGNSNLDKHIGHTVNKRFVVFNNKLVLQHYYYESLVEFDLITGQMTRIYEKPKAINLKNHPQYNIFNVGNFIVVSQDTTKAIETWNDGNSYGWFSTFRPFMQNEQIGPMRISTYGDIMCYVDDSGELMFVLTDVGNNVAHIGSLSDVTRTNEIIFEPTIFDSPVYIDKIITHHTFGCYRIWYRTDPASVWVRANQNGSIGITSDWIQIKLEFCQIADKTFSYPDGNPFEFYDAMLIYRLL